MQKPREKGSSILEFTLVGVPLLFVLVSTVEMARAMWTYHTLAYAVKEGTRYVVVHGQNCSNAPNACSITVGEVAGRIRDAGIGLAPAKLSLSLTSLAGTVNCRLADCLNDTTVWPPAPGNVRGSDIQISGTYPFESGMAMFWPGAGKVQVGSVQFPALSREKIQF